MPTNEPVQFPYFVGARTEIESALVGVGAGNERRDRKMMSVAGAGYKRANCFCPPLSDLREFVLSINRKAKALGDKNQSVHNQAVPSIPTLREAVAGNAVSLESLVKIHRAVRGIVKEHAHDPETEFLRTTATALASNSIIPAFWYASSEALTKVRTSVAGTQDVYEFSRQVFADEVPRQRFHSAVNPGLVVHAMEGGYRDGQGDHTFTEALARSYYNGAQKIAQARNVGLAPFEELFSLSENPGSRNGHSSRALPENQGNIVEFHPEYSTVVGITEDHLLLSHDKSLPKPLAMGDLFAELRAGTAFNDIQQRTN